jgi:hypothetical protein
MSTETLVQELKLSSLKQRNALLYWFGWINIAALVLAVVMSQTDNTMITGVNAWIKPMKFSISIAIYSWTFAWLLAYLPDKKKVMIIAWTVVVCMVAENALIYLQAFRGVRSHFNVSSGLDTAIFNVMGIMILINSIAILYTIKLFFSPKVHLGAVMLWAWRAGLIFFFIGGISGGIMAARLGHTVGAPDGGPGLPFVNWSTVAGDIRMAHFFTLHGLQLIPLAAAVLLSIARENAGKLLVIFTFSYLAICLWMHWLALNALALISM